MFLYGLPDSTQCILIDISISCYQCFAVYLFVDVKINFIQCQCQCLNDRERALLSFFLPTKTHQSLNVSKHFCPSQELLHRKRVSKIFTLYI